MKIVVIGGSGLIGSKLVKKLREHGHEALAASPNSGVNTLTGEGLAEALKGASVVVDVSNSPSFEEQAALTSSLPRQATCFAMSKPQVCNTTWRCPSWGLSVSHKEGRRMGKKQFAVTFEQSLCRRR